MKTKWKRALFDYAKNPYCTDSDRPDQLQGWTEQYGVFAIESETCKVTHIPSGLAFPWYFKTVGVAKQFCETLLTAVGVETLKQLSNDSPLWRGHLVDGVELGEHIKLLAQSLPMRA